MPEKHRPLGRLGTQRWPIGCHGFPNGPVNAPPPSDRIRHQTSAPSGAKGGKWSAFNVNVEVPTDRAVQVLAEAVSELLLAIERHTTHGGPLRD